MIQGWLCSMDPSMLTPVGTVLTLVTQIITLCDKAGQLQKSIRPLKAFLRLVEEILRDVDEDALAASRASRLVLGKMFMCGVV